jgi:hypothetical protein
VIHRGQLAGHKIGMSGTSRRGTIRPVAAYAGLPKCLFLKDGPSKPEWLFFARKEFPMPLFEVETDAHIIITWAADEAAAGNVVREAYPSDKVIRMTKRPRDTWVISKGALGLTNKRVDVCTVARDCLSKAAGDKVHAIRLYMHETGTDLDHARKVIESNMVMGW